MLGAPLLLAGPPTLREHGRAPARCPRRFDACLRRRRFPSLSRRPSGSSPRRLASGSRVRTNAAAGPGSVGSRTATAMRLSRTRRDNCYPSAEAVMRTAQPEEHTSRARCSFDLLQHGSGRLHSRGISPAAGAAARSPVSTSGFSTSPHHFLKC